MDEKKFEWCGYEWECCMEGGRIIHPGQPWMWYDSEMTTIGKDETIELNAVIKPKEVKYWDGRTYYPKYAVGTFRSVNGFGYGKYSCDIQMPQGTNCWPAFWMTGVNSWPPEIDIAEAWNNSKGSYFRLTIPQFPYLVPSWWVTNNIHFINEEEKTDDIGLRGVSYCKLKKNPANNFVNYSCLWEPKKVTFLVNGKKVRTFDDLPITGTMRVVFDLWGEENGFHVEKPMMCRNFKYEAI